VILFTSSRVLIVEEDGFHALLLANALKAHNHIVEIAENASGVLEKAEMGRFDVIVLDLGSAERQFGMALCKRLRESGDDTPIVALTAHLDSITKIAALAAGVLLTRGPDVVLPKGSMVARLPAIAGYA
jgi:DNA-binding response OmpR family regulator